jgi:hypothetical protein
MPPDGDEQQQAMLIRGPSLAGLTPICRDSGKCFWLPRELRMGLMVAHVWQLWLQPNRRAENVANL